MDKKRTFVGGGLGNGGEIAASINHYIDEHGYRLLHVGTQTNHGDGGTPWHHTIAVLGHDNPPTVQPAANVVVGFMQ